MLSGTISVGEECGDGQQFTAPPVKGGVSVQPQADDSPKRRRHTMISGQKQIDHLLHTFIDYIVRDFIDSWLTKLTENREFSECRVRNCIEESLLNAFQRIRNTQWQPLITQKLIEDVATHTRLYRLAQQATNDSKTGAMAAAAAAADSKASPQRRSKRDAAAASSTSAALRHRRNKSDTDLSWYLGAASVQKNVANSKFYTEPIDEKTLCDPEAKLLKSFFDISDLYRNECLDEAALESNFFIFSVCVCERKLIFLFLFFRILDTCDGNVVVFYVAARRFRLCAVAHIFECAAGQCRVQTNVGHVVRSGFH